MLMCTPLLAQNTTKYNKTKLIKHTLVDFYNTEQELLCYQCEADSRRPLQMCESALLNHAKPEKLNALLFQCPHFKKHYCIKQIILYENFFLTMRGCSGQLDDNGNELREGCVTFRSDIDKTMEILCICSKNKCNGAELILLCKFYLLLCFICNLQ